MQAKLSNTIYKLLLNHSSNSLSKSSSNKDELEEREKRLEFINKEYEPEWSKMEVRWEKNFTNL